MRAKQFVIQVSIGVCLLLVVSGVFGDFGKRVNADNGTPAIKFDSFNNDLVAQQPCPTPILERRKCPWSPSGYSVEPCGPGFCWDAGPQGSLACKQETGVPNSGRNYTSDLVCNEGYVAERDRCTNVILRCVKPGAPTAPGSPTTGGTVSLPTWVEQILPELNKWLTGSSTPQSPDQTGAFVATTIGAVLLSLLALSNYLLSNPSFVQRFFRAKASEPTAEARPATSTTQAAGGGGAGASRPLNQPLSRPTTFPEQSSSGGASASAGAPSPASGQPSYQSVANGSAGASPRLPTEPGELLSALGEQAQEKAIESIPDARDTVAEKLVDRIGEAEKRRRVGEEKKRLEARVAEKMRAYQDAGNALKRVIDTGGDFGAAQRAWQQAGAELQAAQYDLQQFLKAFPEKKA